MAGQPHELERGACVQVSTTDPPLEAFEDVPSFFPILEMANTIPIVTKISAVTTVKPAPKNPVPTISTPPCSRRPAGIGNFVPAHRALFW